MSQQQHTAVYVRVSTVGQDHASQLPDLERWVDQHDGPVAWYRDKFTGKTMERPGMVRLLEAIACGQVARVVVWRLDRLGRTAKGLCSLFDELRERRVDLVSIRDGFSLNTPAGRLHARILASVAEYENEVRSERVRAGQAVARARGKRWGGGVKGKRIKVTSEQESAILDMIRRGAKVAAVARVVGLSRPTVYSILRNRDIESLGSAG